MRYGSVCSGVGSCRLAAPDSWSGAWFAEMIFERLDAVEGSQR